MVNNRVKNAHKDTKKNAKSKEVEPFLMKKK